MKRKLLFVMSIVLLLALVAIPAAAQSYPDPGQGSTYTVLQNKTDESANATVTYYNQMGNPQAGPNPTISGYGTAKIDPAGTQLPQDFNGAAVVSSDKPLASTANTKWTGSSAGDSYEMGLYSGVAAGSGRICFPSLFKTPAIVGSFAVQNTGTGTADISLTYYSRAGANEGQFTDSIPPGAQHTYDLRTPGAMVPNVPDGWDGSAIVEVTNGQTVAGVGVVNQAGRSVTYNAANCEGVVGNTELVVASQYRGYGGTDPSIISQYYLWSAINVQNLENSEASVTLQYTPRDNTKPSKTINATIPALSAQGWNTRTPAFDDLGGSSDTGGWDGTVVITSNKGIAATVNTQWRGVSGVEAGYYSAANASDENSKYFVPNVRRIDDGSEIRLFSALLIMNIGNSATDVTTKYYDLAGTEVHSYNESIDPGEGVGYNTRGGTGGTAALGPNFEGSAVVESNGQPLAVVLNNRDRNPFASATTNGVPE